MASEKAKNLSLLQKYTALAMANSIKPRTQTSYDWFIKKVKSINKIASEKMISDPALKPSKGPLIGRMFMYIYDPKTKEDLPFYDRFPLIILLRPAEGGFVGLNLHYLGPRERAAFFDALLDYTNNKRYDDSTRFSLTYNMLQATSKLKAFEPCIKRYLTSHVRSAIMEVKPEDWESAVFLPFDSFVAAPRSSVWAKSRYRINNKH